MPCLLVHLCTALAGGRKEGGPDPAPALTHTLCLGAPPTRPAGPSSFRSLGTVPPTLERVEPPGCLLAPGLSQGFPSFCSRRPPFPRSLAKWLPGHLA